MGGAISVESEVGRGSTFSFIACFEAADAPPDNGLKALNLVSYRGLRVLTVDDNATNGGILCEWLNKWGMQPTWVDGGQKALEALSKAELKGTPFQLIVLDAHMPGMDGFTLADRIRVSSSRLPAPIMMLSSGDRSDDARRCRESGIDTYLLKPINPPELLEALLERLRSTPAQDLTSSAEPRQAAPKKFAPLEILVVEDNLVNQRLILRLLEKRGHSVT